MRIRGDDVGFASVSALSVRIGDDGAELVEPVVLRRAVTGSSVLWDWFAEATAGGDDAGGDDVVVELWSERHEHVLVRWVLVGARPVRWTGPALDANVQAVAVEELALTCRRVEWFQED